MDQGGVRRKVLRSNGTIFSSEYRAAIAIGGQATGGDCGRLVTPCSVRNATAVAPVAWPPIAIAAL